MGYHLQWSDVLNCYLHGKKGLDSDNWIDVYIFIPPDGVPAGLSNPPLYIEKRWYYNGGSIPSEKYF